MDVGAPLTAVITAVAMCAVNTTVGLFIARSVFGKDLKLFVAVVFGSLAVRALLVLIGAWYCLSIVEMHQVAFALTFAIVGFVMLMGEILFFHLWLEKQKRQVRLPVSEMLKKKLDELLSGTFLMSEFA